MSLLSSQDFTEDPLDLPKVYFNGLLAASVFNSSICTSLRSLSTSVFGLASQFLYGTHEFSELVLARKSLFMNQSSSVLQLRSAKAREFGELWRQNVRARLGPFHLKWTELILFGRAELTNGKRPHLNC